MSKTVILLARRGQFDNWLILVVFAYKRVDYTVKFRTIVRPKLLGRLKIA